MIAITRLPSPCSPASASPLGTLAYAPASRASPRVTAGVRIGVPPPPVRVVRVRPRPGYAWTPGYRRWRPRIHRHVWAEGYRVRERRHHDRRERREREDREWRHHRGHWHR